jgi:superfamily II DNA/RNA helicase
MMMFSATINREVMDLINKYMHKPVLVDLTEGQKYKLPTNIDHYVNNRKEFFIDIIVFIKIIYIKMVKASFNSNFNLIKNYIDEFKSKRCIVFANTKSKVI